MNERLKSALEQKLNHLAAQDVMLCRAIEFYTQIFRNQMVSKSQMAGLVQRIRRATTAELAKSDAVGYLNHQMEKLKKREAAGSLRTSWLVGITIGEEEKTIGEVAIDWIENDWHLSPTGGVEPVPLASFQRFWSQVDILCRYHRNMGEVPNYLKENC